MQDTDVGTNAGQVQFRNPSLPQSDVQVGTAKGGVMTLVDPIDHLALPDSFHKAVLDGRRDIAPYCPQDCGGGNKRFSG